ncbi:MAG: SusE domain-containing protein [Clostridium sp.]|nr:SusE domain-containing protein [Bacteroides sp.]MCM1198194.1 SusE domain-containing protein [Clostridium sp.]
MRTILLNTTVMVYAAAVLLAGCMPEGRQINYDVQPGDELYLPAEAAEIDLARGADVDFQWAPSMAHDNGYISYELLIDREDGDFSSPVAVFAGQLNGSKPCLSLSSKNLNVAARAAGIGRRETGVVKWTAKASKGLYGSVYSEARTLVVTTMNSMEPLPQNVQLKGEAVEQPENGIGMTVSRGIDNVPATEGNFECFTRIKGSTDFTISDELGRYYSLNDNGTVEYSETPVTCRMPAEAIYWLKIDFGVMTWSYNTVSKVEFYAAAYADNKMTTANETMTYVGNGVWELLNYANTVSDNSANDTRHRFNATLGDGSKLYLGTQAGLGTSYTTDYLKVNFYTKETIGNVDWDKTYNFLVSDCGRKLDCYLYLNGDNPAGTWWHEYKFK